MAGSEDQLALNQIIRDRQRLICSGWIDRLFEILSEAGMIDLPEDYQIRFPVQEAATEKQKAENGDMKASSIQKIIQAASQPAGDGLDIKSAFSACGLADVDIEEVDLDDIDDEMDSDLDGE